MKLTIKDFISDYQHLIVRGDSKEKIIKFIDDNYALIKEDCLNYMNKN